MDQYAHVGKCEHKRIALKKQVVPFLSFSEREYL